MPNRKNTTGSLENNISNKNDNVNKESKIISSEQDTETLKQKQLDIILENNPAWADDRTWIRSAKDIKTFSEVTTPAIIRDGYTPE